MQLVPSQEEVVQLLRDSGALRDGHFEYPDGMHSDEYLQIPLAFRHYQNARILSVGLSRKLRSNPELRANISQFSVVAPATGGLPVAFGVCEALRANQVYWAERDDPTQPMRMRFRQFLSPHNGEQVILVDDILRSGSKLTELRGLLEGAGAKVVGLGVIVYQPTPHTLSFGDLPLYYLAKLNAAYYADAGSCELCRRGLPLEKVWL
jgi:orotate phosphoribosyltransferase